MISSAAIAPFLIILGNDNVHIPFLLLIRIWGITSLGRFLRRSCRCCSAGIDAADAGTGIDDAVPADDGAGVQHAVAADLHPVAQHGAHLFAVGGDLLALVVDDHQGLSLLTLLVMEPAPMWAL